MAADKTAESHNFCVRSIFSVDYGVPLKCLFLYIFQRFVKPHCNWLFSEMHSLLSHICQWSVEILFIYIVGVWLALSEDIRNCVGPSSVWETCGLTLRYSYNGREHKGFVWEFRWKIQEHKYSLEFSIKYTLPYLLCEQFFKKQLDKQQRGKAGSCWRSGSAIQKEITLKVEGKADQTAKGW